MSIRVRLQDLLAYRAASKRDAYEIEFRPGITAGEIIRAEGFGGPDLDAIAVMVNGEQAEHGASLRDGDQVEYLIAMVGGHGWGKVRIGEWKVQSGE